MRKKILFSVLSLLSAIAFCSNKVRAEPIENTVIEESQVQEGDQASGPETNQSQEFDQASGPETNQSQEGDQASAPETNEDLTLIGEKIDNVADLLVKTMLSIWSCTGLYMGTKLMRGLFNE